MYIYIYMCVCACVQYVYVCIMQIKDAIPYSNCGRRMEKTSTHIPSPYLPISLESSRPLSFLLLGGIIHVRPARSSTLHQGRHGRNTGDPTGRVRHGSARIGTVTIRHGGTMAQWHVDLEVLLLCEVHRSSTSFKLFWTSNVVVR